MSDPKSVKFLNTLEGWTDGDRFVSRWYSRAECADIVERNEKRFGSLLNRKLDDEFFAKEPR